MFRMGSKKDGGQKNQIALHFFVSRSVVEQLRMRIGVLGLAVTQHWGRE